MVYVKYLELLAEISVATKVSGSYEVPTIFTIQNSLVL